MLRAFYAVKVAQCEFTVDCLVVCCKLSEQQYLLCAFDLRQFLQFSIDQTIISIRNRLWINYHINLNSFPLFFQVSFHVGNRDFMVQYSGQWSYVSKMISSPNPLEFLELQSNSINQSNGIGYFVFSAFQFSIRKTVSIMYKL